jgi:hypothetical protein
MSSSSTLKRRSSSRSSGPKTHRDAVDPASFITTVLVGIILAAAPLVLGSARLWYELPLLGGVALLLLLQGLRLTRPLASGSVRMIDAIDISVVLFVIYAIARWLTSPAEYFSRVEVLNIVAYAVVFFTCRYGITQRKHGLALLFGLVALGLGEAIFGYYLSQHLDWFPFGDTERLHVAYAPRWTGTYGCPNHYGEFMVMAIGATLALGCFSKLPWPARIVLIYVACIMAVGVMFSISRGSYLALIAAILALTLFGLRHGTVRWWIPLGCMMVVLAVGISVFQLSSNVRQYTYEAVRIVKEGEVDGYIRVTLARDALRIASDQPVFGTGPGTFVFIHPRYQDKDFKYKAVLTHDDYLNCLDDYGLVGFGIAMFFVWSVMLTFFGPLWADHRWHDRTIIAAAFAAFCALVIHSTVDFNLHIPANALIFFALIGLGLGRLKKDHAVRHWSTISLSRLGGWVGWAVVLLSLLFGCEVGRTATSDILYEQAYNHWDEIPISESMANAEQAMVYDPANVQAMVFLGDLHRYEASRKENIDDRISEGQKALGYYQQAIKANALDDTIYGKMGLTFDVMRRYSEAYFCYKTAVAAQPYEGQFWYALGNHYWQRGMLEKAEEAYVRASHCQNGSEGSQEALAELRSQPAMQGVPPPSENANPILESQESAPATDVDQVEEAAPMQEASPANSATENPLESNTAPAMPPTQEASPTPVNQPVPANPEDHPPTVP